MSGERELEEGEVEASPSPPPTASVPVQSAAKKGLGSGPGRGGPGGGGGPVGGNGMRKAKKEGSSEAPSVQGSHVNNHSKHFDHFAPVFDFHFGGSEASNPFQPIPAMPLPNTSVYNPYINMNIPVYLPHLFQQHQQPPLSFSNAHTLHFLSYGPEFAPLARLATVPVTMQAEYIRDAGPHVQQETRELLSHLSTTRGVSIEHLSELGIASNLFSKVGPSFSQQSEESSFQINPQQHCDPVNAASSSSFSENNFGTSLLAAEADDSTDDVAGTIQFQYDNVDPRVHKRASTGLVASLVTPTSSGKNAAGNGKVNETPSESDHPFNHAISKAMAASKAANGKQSPGTVRNGAGTSNATKPQLKQQAKGKQKQNLKQTILAKSVPSNIIQPIIARNPAKKLTKGQKRQLRLQEEMRALFAQEGGNTSDQLASILKARGSSAGPVGGIPRLPIDPTAAASWGMEAAQVPKPVHAGMGNQKRSALMKAYSVQDDSASPQLARVTSREAVVTPSIFSRSEELAERAAPAEASKLDLLRAKLRARTTVVKRTNALASTAAGPSAVPSTDAIIATKADEDAAVRFLDSLPDTVGPETGSDMEFSEEENGEDAVGKLILGWKERVTPYMEGKTFASPLRGMVARARGEGSLVVNENVRMDEVMKEAGKVTEKEMEEEEVGSAVQLESEDEEDLRAQQLLEQVGMMGAGKRPSASVLNVLSKAYRPPPRVVRPEPFIPRESAFKTYVIYPSDNDDTSDEEEERRKVGSALGVPPTPVALTLEEKIARMREEIAEKEKMVRERKAAALGSSSESQESLAETVSSEVMPIPIVVMESPISVSSSPNLARTPVALKVSSVPGSPLVGRTVGSPATTMRDAVHPSSRLSASTNASLAATKSSLEDQIKSDEVLLGNALTDMQSKQEQILDLAKVAAQHETALNGLRDKVIEIEAALEPARAAVEAKKAEADETIKAADRLKRVVLMKGEVAATLQAALNRKRVQLLEVSKAFAKQQQQQQLQNHLGLKRGAVSDGGPNKRTKHESMEEVVRKVDEDGFIRFDDLFQSESLNVADAAPASSSTMEGPDGELTELQRARKFAQIAWEEPATTERLVVIGYSLIRASDLCGLRDLPRSCTSEARLVAPGLNKNAVSAIPTVERPLPLVDLRSYRYFGAGGNTKVLGAFQKDIFKAWCQREIDEGKCNDPGCSDKHMKEASLNENELVLDILSRIDEDQNIDSAELRKVVQENRGKGKSYDELIRAIADFRNAHDSRPVVFKSTAAPILPEKKESPSIDLKVFRNAGYIPAWKRAQEFPPAMLPKEQTVFMEGVQRLLVRKSSKIEEWDFWTSEDFKEHIERDPENVSLRIRYSISLLPSPLTLKDLRKRVSVTPAITALANALQTMPESEDLWMLYLELYVKNPSAKDGDVRDMFENGLCYLPECLGLWWRYVAFEQEYSRAEALLKRMLITFVSDKCELKDPILRSSTVLSIAAQLAKLYADTGCNTDLARAFLSTFLFSKEASDVTTFSSDKTPKEAKNYVLPLSLTWASRMLTLQDLAIAWLIYIHFFYHGHIPFSVFHAHPHSYLVRDELFLIKWDAGGMSVRDAVQAPSGAEMSWFKQLFQNCLDSWGSIELGDDASANMAYMAILRNYVSFIELRSKPARVSRFLSGLIECRIVDIDIMLLQPFEDIKEADILFPGRFHVVNHCVKQILKLDTDSIPSKSMELLINSIRSCYEDLRPVSITSGSDVLGIINEAISLYQKALSISADLKTPGFVACISDSAFSLKTNPYLWLNYLLLQSMQLSKAECLDESHQRLISLRSIFEKSLELLKSKEDRAVMWHEYLRLELDSSSDKAEPKALAVLWRALKDFECVEQCPFDKTEGQFAKWIPLTDHRQGSELMQTLLKNLDSLSAAKETDRVLAVHPSLIYQNPSFSKFYFETDSVDAGKNFLANCLRVNPKSGWLWRLLYALEDIGGVFGTVESATRIAELAMEFMSSKDGELFQELRKRLTLPLTGNVA